MPQPIATPVRQAIRQRWLVGQDSRTIAWELGLAERTVRRFLRRLRADQTDTLTPRYAYADPDAPRSPVQQAALQMRRDHPTWGALLIWVMLSHDFPKKSLPSARTLQRWFARAGLNPAPKGRRPRSDYQRAAHPHDVWQMDASELVRLGSGQRVCWLRLGDEHTGAVLHTKVFPQARWASVAGSAVQAELRQAFRRWGRPGTVRVDNGGPWVAKGELPTDLALWLLGLDIPLHLNPVRSPQSNGVVERMQGVGKDWGEPQQCHSPEELAERLQQMDAIQRAEYPRCPGRRSRLEAYPALTHSGREYSTRWEQRHWDREGVKAGLGGYVTRRRVCCKGTISIYNRNYYVGEKHRKQTVLVLFDPVACEWVCTDTGDQQLRRWPAAEICRRRIVSLDVSHH